MNKRLRKKKHRGEFTQYAFDVRASWAGTDDVWDRFLALCDERALMIGGGLGPEADFVADACTAPRCTDHHRRNTTDEADRAWMRATLEELGATNIVIGPLFDANYGEPPTVGGS